ncbi:hypothetical protein [Pseudomonas sp. DG56-2]|uniref:hypothetical protein n=1 Tax=Pseudomonas sp. DG56-2 TaxID=2320270 RepID=UPI0010A5E7A0|nr:hypothetical protein [Pseudomonas sp. DG56-2]
MSTIDRWERTLSFEGLMLADIAPPTDTGNPFKADLLDIYRLGNDIHVWGLQGDVDENYSLILFMIPENIANGDHPIVPEGADGIRAVFVTSRGASFASSGVVKRLEKGEKVLRAGFFFVASIDDREHIVQGNVTFENIGMSERADSVVSSVTAKLSPGLIPKVESFEASGFEFHKKSEMLYELHAWQTLRSGDEQAIIMLVSFDNLKAPALTLFAKNSGVYLTKNSTLNGTEWDKVKQTFTAGFSFEFNAGGKTHKVQDGKIDLKY